MEIQSSRGRKVRLCCLFPLLSLCENLIWKIAVRIGKTFGNFLKSRLYIGNIYARPGDDDESTNVGDSLPGGGRCYDVIALGVCVTFHKLFVSDRKKIHHTF